MNILWELAAIQTLFYLEYWCTDIFYAWSARALEFPRDNSYFAILLHQFAGRLFLLEINRGELHAQLLT
jgi:hypothetical protein